MRFNTDRALFDAFPSARDHVKTEPTGGTPAAFLKLLLDCHSFDEAISFCAYLLPRREAVAWGCRCLRSNLRDGASSHAASPALLAAEAWAEAPSEERRRTAHACWEKGDKESPASWLALGAAWSGASVAPDTPNPMPAAPHLTATMVRVALILLLHPIPKIGKPNVAREWIADGSRIAEFGL
ncbi:DUF6931 family protein [Lichenifustis flavocetrariae]|uniref:Uncharacterized protein n=1 Tax=Lichenifustis flavocetrariae TaxID=2949735 RepID=A0AA41YXH0_9HYPH|nr:hypothetical protein [Lichenifustis flavocetrariae]MCW6506728.1 hypothetical protein [Lichenifustis flavocetrariae]